MAADQYPNINFPTVDFSWLGNLPKVAEEARLQRVRQSLGDLEMPKLEPLKDESPVDTAARSRAAWLESASKRLLDGGDIEAALRVQNQALALREHLRKKEEGLQYIKALPTVAAANRAIREGAPPAPSPNSYIPNRPPEDTAPPAPDPFGGVPATGTFGTIPGPQTGLPGPGPTVAQAPPSPSDALIAAAQAGGSPPPPPPTRVAQAGPNVEIGTPTIVPSAPAPDVTAAPAPPQALPSWLQGAQAPVVKASPAPVAPRPGPPLQLGPPPTVPTDPEIERRLNIIGEALSKIPPHARFQAKQLEDQYTDLIKQSGQDATTKAWNMSNLDRWREGRPTQSLDQYKMMITTTGARYEEMQKASQGYEADAKKSRDLSRDLDILSTIVKDPRFISGKGAHLFQKGASAVSAARSAAIALGASPEYIRQLSADLGAGPDLEKITEPAKLMEVFEAISNSAIYSKLGSLGSNISNSDRTFVQAANPSLQLTKPGNALLIDIMSAIAKHNILVGARVREYRMKHELSATAPELHDIADKFAEDHKIFYNKDGSLNELGKRVQALPPADITAAGPAAVPKPGFAPGGGGFNRPPDIGQPGMLERIQGGVQGLVNQGRNALGVPGPAPGMPSALNRLPVPGGQGGTIARPDLEGEPRARGGPVVPGQPYRVGEKGPETFVPTSAGVILPHHEGRVFFHTATGRPAGRIRGGKPVFFGKR